jgi:hypothetical protein
MDTTGMSAAAILSVAARKAASEGKKVGAAALTLIALVVMSITVFPGLNRAPADQMAGAPANPETSQDAGSFEVAPSPEAGIVDDTADSESADNTDAIAAGTDSDSSGSSAPKAKKDPIEQVLTGPELGGIMNSDSRSNVFVLDQQYTAVGDNGLSVNFTFNPTSAEVFTGVVVQITLQDMVFDFKPTNQLLFKDKNAEGLDVFLLAGQAPHLVDEYGQKWSETVARNATFTLEVIMDRNGKDVKEVKIALYQAN